MSSVSETCGVRAAFIDRDGVINEEREYVYRTDDFVLLRGAVEGLRMLQRAGYSLVVVTNQAGIARGFYNEDDYARLTNHMRGLLSSEGVELAAVYHCPHHPAPGLGALGQDCDCRKPKPGMLTRARRELGLDLSRSVIVGDKGSDIEAGRAAGLAHCVLVASGHALTPSAHALADTCCSDLAEAAAWIVANSPRLNACQRRK